MQCLDDVKWGEDLVTFFLVVRAAMVLCPIVTAVGSAGALEIVLVRLGQVATKNTCPWLWFGGAGYCW